MELLTQDFNDDLLAAAESGDLAKIRALLAEGADLNAKNSNGQTPLMLAAGTFGRIDTVRTLLSAGAAMNAQDISGRTALVMAILANDVDMVQALLANGADIELKHGLGTTPLMLAVSSSARGAGDRQQQLRVRAVGVLSVCTSHHPPALA